MKLIKENIDINNYCFKIFLSICIIIFFLSFQSCKNDIDLNTKEPKDIPVVYGLLDYNSPIQYIRINKTFLTEGNTLEAAKNMSLCNYTADELEVWLETDNTKTKLIRDTIHNKVSGTFYSPDEIIYRTDNFSLMADKEYTLRIINKKTGKEYTAKTNIISNLHLDQGITNTSTIDFTNPKYPITINWTSTPNGRVYEVKLRFFYEEYNSSNQTSSIDSVDMYIGRVRSEEILGGENMSLSFYGDDFYKYIGYILKANNNITRKVINIKYIFSVGGEDLSTYMTINEPSNGIVQEKPPFTNISNGVGLFSTRFIHDKVKKTLNNRSVDSLRYGRYTKNLGFL
jgi:hypothetical protein